MKLEWIEIRPPYGKMALAACALVLSVFLGIAGYAISRNDGGIIIEKAAKPQEENVPEPAGTQKDKESAGKSGETVKDEIKVYVVGCVNRPGIVALKQGDLIDDAIKAAGGATDEADLENINLAYPLKENVMIRVKSKKDIQNAAKEGGIAVQKQIGSSYAGSGIEIRADSGGAVLSELNGNNSNKKVNINTASTEELDSLPGIGPETAKDIIAYREKNGGFKKTEDIMKVPGIKNSKYNKIKDIITVK